MASWKSSTMFLAISHICKGGRPFSSWTSLFLLYQIDQEIAKKNSRSLAAENELIWCTRPVKSFAFRSASIRQSYQRDHTKRAQSQEIKAWIRFSVSFPQIGQTQEICIPFATIFVSIGRPFTQAHQEKILIFARGFNDQIFFQSPSILVSNRAFPFILYVKEFGCDKVGTF